MARLTNEWRGIGRLTADPKVDFVGEGICLTKFVLAVNEKIKGKDRTEFINCQCWDKVAETIGEYCGKGDKIEVAGSLRIDKYKNSKGENKFFTYINVDRLQFVTKKNTNTKKLPPEAEDSAMPEVTAETINEWTSAEQLQEEIFRPDGNEDIPF